MNVYDFDETIFEGDSEDRFFVFLSKRKGFRLCRPIYKFLEFFTKKHGPAARTWARQIQYRFLTRVDDIDAMLDEYWDEAEQYIKPWYLEQKRSDDIIASGTPAFLMEPIVRRLGIQGLIATDMDKHTGKINGSFAVDKYKMQYFAEKYDPTEIEKFYSDAYSDHFLAEAAKEAYFIHGKNHDQFTPWNEYFSTHPKK